MRAGLRGTAVVLALSSCGGGSELLIVPLFLYGFEGSSGGTAVEVFLLPDRPTTATGRFDTANVTVGAAQTKFDGSWSNCSVSLSLRPGETPPAAPGASSYDGQLQGTDKLVLTPPAGSGRPTLTLTRKPIAPVSGFGC
jgi:hypothetical protein